MMLPPQSDRSILQTTQTARSTPATRTSPRWAWGVRFLPGQKLREITNWNNEETPEKYATRNPGPQLPGCRFSPTKVPYKNLISRTYVGPTDEAEKFVESQLHPHKSCPIHYVEPWNLPHWEHHLYWWAIFQANSGDFWGRNFWDQKPIYSKSID